jgi:hypothetical protein
MNATFPSSSERADYMISWLGQAIGYDPSRSVKSQDCIRAAMEHFKIPGNPTDPWAKTTGRVRYVGQTLVAKGLLARPLRGMWSLTDQGLTLARKLVHLVTTVALPTPTELADYVIGWLGKANRYNSNRSVRTRVCIEAAQSHFGVAGDACKATDLFAARVRSTRHTLTKQGFLWRPAWGQWALTELGISRSREINGIGSDPERSLTSQFLDERLAAGLYDRLLRAVSKKFRVSATCRMVEDHVHTYLAKLVQRDALHDRLTLGQPIYDSKVATWCCRSAQNDIRGMGTNPITRAIYGAQTATERRLGQSRAGVAATPVQVVTLSTDEDAGGYNVDFIDDHCQITDNELQERADVLLSGFVDKLAAVSDHRKEDLVVLHLLAQEYTATEIADAQGWTRGQAKARIARVRQLLA